MDWVGISIGNVDATVNRVPLAWNSSTGYKRILTVRLSRIVALAKEPGETGQVCRGHRDRCSGLGDGETGVRCTGSRTMC